MTSPLHKRRPTTAPSTSERNCPNGRRAAIEYAAIDRATRRSEPLWLPAAWLAVVVMLTAAAPSFGGDGWRPRGAVKRSAVVAKPQAAVRQVGFQEDIAGPGLRTASGAIYDAAVRGVQQESSGGGDDPLRDSFQRPFGVEEEIPAGRPTTNTLPEADEADQLFDDVPDEPAPLDDEPAMDEDGSDAEAKPGSVFDFEKGPKDAEEVAPPAANESAEEEDEDEPTPRDDTAKRAKERTEAMQNCSEGLAQLKASRLDAIDLRIAVAGAEGEDFPHNCSLDDGSLFAPRCWCEVTYMWKASGLCHKPLYFEQVHLERYGHSWGPIAQPILSGAHFFGTIPLLPYKMGLQAPNECVYALGYYRPGNCAPYLLDPIPFTWRAALFQAGATVGVAAILP